MREDEVVVDDGAHLWVDVTGAGVPVVLCHGGPGLWDNLGALAALLAEVVRVVRWKQRGCGRSDRRGPYTVERVVADLDQLRHALGVQRWFVGGHSWGATLALFYAFAQPTRVLGLAYISGTGVGRAWNAAYHEEEDRRLTADQRARRDELRAITTRSEEQEHEYRTLCWAPGFADRATALELASREAAVPFAVNYECNAALNGETKTWEEETLLERCRDLQVPVIILHGGEDPRPSWAVDSLHAALPHSQLQVLAGAGHQPWIEKPNETTRLLRSFLRDTGES